MKIDKLHSQHTVEIPSTTANREHTKLAHGKFAEDQEFNILKNTEAKSLWTMKKKNKYKSKRCGSHSLRMSHWIRAISFWLQFLFDFSTYKKKNVRIFEWTTRAVFLFYFSSVFWEGNEFHVAHVRSNVKQMKSKELLDSSKAKSILAFEWTCQNRITHSFPSKQ